MVQKESSMNSKFFNLHRFVVDTKDVIAFENHNPKITHPELAQAFEKAMQDYKDKINSEMAPKQKNIIFHSAGEFAQFIEDFCMDQLLNNN